MGRFLEVNDAQGRHPESWYAATATPPPPEPPPSGALRADVAVIGGGFAGLSAAYHLAKAGRDVALIDAHRVGWGASGRNGGQLARFPRRGVSFYERALGREDAKRILEIAEDANTLVRALVAGEEIACELADGHLQAHHRRRYDAGAEAEVAQLQEVYGVRDLEVLSPLEVQEISPAAGFFGGVFDRRAGHLHPLKYALGLAAAARRVGARVYENARALDIDVDAGRIRLADASLSAEQIVLALNGYHDRIERRGARRIMPLNNFILATEPLGARLRTVLARNVSVSDSRFVINYYRRSPNGRLLFGGGESTATRFPQPLLEVVRRPMLRLFPELADARVDYVWGGTLGISASRAPVFMRLGRRAVSIGAWSGSGVHMASMGGKIAAEALMGESARFDLLAKAPTPPFPGGDWFRSPFLTLALAWYRLRDWF